ncbi:hypothetical protein F3F96_08725 [Mariprofundus sp. NF]|uniref:hypothetical protein n=1 Tax=Mariprofundus sp. NF TaxID=2608716 RepID=UPI0015A46E41|nr:hypothetical protein [Mariprofundus sp. NF]NWF39218.1 hypothetical protein [Mariprofundus sp. NF]
MAIERIYFEAENFVLTLIYGKLTNSELTTHVVEMNRDYNHIKGVRELADCRFLTDVSELTGSAVLHSAELEEGNSRVIGGRGAIVATSDLIYGLANMYAAVASNIRDESRVFRSMDEALQWLEIDPIRAEVESLISEEAYQQRNRASIK